MAKTRAAKPTTAAFSYRPRIFYRVSKRPF
jgi:hypothetical protein